MKLNRPKTLVGIILVIICLFPLIISPFYLILSTEIFLMAIFALSFNLLFGYTGLLSFGQGAYFATGAYVCAYLLKKFLPFVGAIIISIILAFLLAAIFGYFSVRLNKIYFAMLTLALGMMVYTMIFQGRELTGGSDGITGITITQIGIPGLNFDWQNFTHYYYLSLFVFLLSTYLIWRITHSPFGELLQASRENSQRLIFTGVDIRQLHWLAFTIAGVFAGLAGALWSPFQRVANPEIAHWTFSAMPVLMTILGGYRRFAGPIVGASLFILLEHFVKANQRYFWQWLASLSILPANLATRQLDLWNMGLGLLLIILILGFKEGILASFVKVSKNFSKN